MMRRLTSTNYTETTLSLALLVLRIGVGVLMIHHGYNKLSHFSEYQPEFMNFWGLGSSISLALVVFAELVCSALILIGLFTSVSCVPLIIAMLVAVIMAHDGAVFAKGELATLYLFVYVAIMIVGPGKYSLDALIFNKNS